jgi:pimeloyl-ACP methyl ester carboxylesterase
MKFCPVPGISQFMGGAASDQPERYREISAMSLLPIGVPQTIISGGLLKGQNDLVTSYEAAATSKGDSVRVVKLEGSGHFDMLAPESQYGKPIIEAILALSK